MFSGHSSSGAIVVELAEVEGTSTPKQEKEVRQSKAWARKEFGGKSVWDWMDLLIDSVVRALVTGTRQQDNRQEAIEKQ